MSDLLNSASLVMIPSGYKEDVVYSQIPTDGSGDLTFTRASNGTRVNSAGLVEVTPWNLFQYSEDFSNAIWTKKSTISLTANATTAPNGTNTATKIYANSNGTVDYGFFQVLTSQSGTLSVYAKKSELNYLYIGKNNDFASDGVFFNLNTGVISQNTGGYTASIESVGNGWYRCIAYFPTISYCFVSPSVDGTSFIFSNQLNNGLFIWGAQLNIGTTAKPYFPTTDRLNVPRLTYQNGGGGCPSLLLEKQSTNVATQSTITSFGSGANDWLNGAGSPASINQTTGIDGTQNGTKYTRTAGQTTNDFFYKNQVPVTSGTTYTVSGYIKLGTASNAVVVINNTAAWNSVPNGSIVCSTANGFSTTAWKRFELTITGPSTNKINIHYGYHEETGLTAQADGTFFLDGLQVEASSYATSLIPTTSSSATRVADLSANDVFGTTYTLDADFCLFQDFECFDFGNFPVFWSGGNYGTGGDYRSYMIAYSTNNIVLFGINEVTTAQLTAFNFSTSTRYKVAVRRVGSTINWFVNGIKYSNTSGTTTTTVKIRSISGASLGGQNVMKLNEAIIFEDKTLTDEDCISLTTI